MSPWYKINGNKRACTYVTRVVSVVACFLYSLCSFANQMYAWNEREIVFQPLLSYEMSEKVVEVGRPAALSFDEDGSMFVLDVLMRKVHIWDKDGKYVRSFGGEGEGPGEFQFRNRVGDILVFGDRVIVVDESTSKIHFFDRKTLGFQRSIARPNELSRFYLFRAGFDGSLFALNISGGRSVQEVLRLDDDLRVEDVLISRPYEQYERKKDGSFIFRPYANVLRVFPFGDEIVVGESQDSLFRVFDGKGDEVRSFRVPFVQSDVSAEDRAYHRERFSRRGIGNMRLDLGEKDSFFDMIAGVGDVFLVMRLDRENTMIDGIAYDRQYRRLGAFSTSFGELVYFGRFRDRVIVVSLREDGEYQMGLYGVVTSTR